MHKFFVNESNVYDDYAEITGDDVKHIYKVLRLKPEDKVYINNCNGKEFLGEITEVSKQNVSVKILEEVELNNESPIDVYLFQGLPKSSKLELIIQKGTELGLKEITPIITNRVLSAIKNIDNERKKIERWNKIALEACKQCKRTLIPKINEITEFDKSVDLLKEMDLVLVPYENAEKFGIKKVINDLDKEIKKIGIVIGPEGGFEEEEIDMLKNIEAKIITLGPRILRTETAGLVAASLIMYELGDLGGNI
ncbi:16S rRNA (uracil(1498)-N(3))-methyltransferase [Clostridium sediminicola]|uniref:16S rRNA (uracil(1498)-N(3))-methyltransferase n=1 Tax=Clostridium sediminicola TaxID=3114879 RepID=UPI0031F27C5E